MTDVFFAIQKQIDSTRNIVIFALIMARVMSIVLLTPFLGGKNAPPTVKMGIGITLTFVLWPTVVMSMPGDVPITPVGFILMMMKEAFVGLIMGFICAEVFYTVEISGQLVDIFRGANQIQVQVPEIQERSSAFGNFNYQLLLCLFLALGLHTFFIETLFESFRLIPINTLPGIEQGFWALTDALLKLGQHILTTAVMLAAPIAMVSLITETTFGLMNKVAPQINAYFMAFPAKVFAGVAVFYLALELIVSEMLKHSYEMLQLLEHIVGLLE